MSGYLFWIGIGFAGAGYWKLLPAVLARSPRRLRFWLPPLMTALGLLTTVAYELAFSLFGTAWKTPVDLLLLAIWLVNYPVFAITLLLWGSPADQLHWPNTLIAAAEFWLAWYMVIWLSDQRASDTAISIRQ
jgi:hypothetical protein